MPCAEWCQLVERYRSAVDTYNEAVMALGGVSGTAFNEKWSRTEQARTQCDRCRTDLLHHEHVHACLVVGQPNGKKQVSGINTENMVLGDQGQSGG